MISGLAHIIYYIVQKYKKYFLNTKLKMLKNINFGKKWIK